MRLKTILIEPEIQFTLTTSELVWLQVLLHNIIYKDSLSGWIEEVQKLSDILDRVKKEGECINRTSPEFENSELRFLK